MSGKAKNENNKRKSLFSHFNFDISDETKKDVFGILFIVLSIISALSFFDMAGSLGVNIKNFARLLFGSGFIFISIYLAACGIKAIKSKSADYNNSFFIFAFFIFLSILIFLHISYNLEDMFFTAKEGRGGGLLGMIFAWTLVKLLGTIGAFVVTAAFALISFLVVFNTTVLSIIHKLKPRKQTKNKSIFNIKEDYKNEENFKKNEEKIKINISGKEIADKKSIFSLITNKIIKSVKNKKPKFSVKSITKEESGTGINHKNAEKEDSKLKGITSEKENGQTLMIPELKKEKELDNGKINWKIPPFEILNKYDGEPTSGDIIANSNIIKRTLRNFGIMVEMGDVNVGPTVTQYTLKPAVGVKLSRITCLNNDLALALSARSVRIEAPIPGKPLVGIEIPNKSVAAVRLRNIIDSDEFRRKKYDLAIVLGRDVTGKSVLADLAKMPHLLIAGATGSGKTVCINVLITGLLFQNSPEVLKFILVDPKRVELTFYNDIPHLLAPVITDSDKAINSLKWSISEMENRYETLSHFGCRNIESYNKEISVKLKRKIMPYIVIVIDELADIMATHGREMEAAVVRLAQMARAVGIHLVLSTQRPSVDTITGLIKANITTRIAFQVASQIDSRTIIDTAGAEKLLGNGDMLYLSGDSNKPIRIQGVFISEDEVKKVVDFLKSQKKDREEKCDENITDEKKSLPELSFPYEDEIKDDLYEEAVEEVKNAGKASASFLQRRLRIGYARAARLLDIMQENGIVGPADGAKPREVFIGKDIKSENNEQDENRKN